MNSVRQRSILPGPYSKIRTSQGTNQNAPFHLGQVQPYNKYIFKTLKKLPIRGLARSAGSRGEIGETEEGRCVTQVNRV